MMQEPTSDWRQQGDRYIATGNYTQAEVLYRQAIEAEPDVASHYWHLGLVRLLQGEEMEAQAIWMTPLAAGDEAQVADWTLELLQVLDTEAARQHEQRHYDRAWLIRQHLREIAPDALNNLLLLVQLDIVQEQFAAEQLEDWGVLEALAVANPGEVNLDLLLQVVTQVLFCDEVLLGDRADDLLSALVNGAAAWVAELADYGDRFTSIVGQAANKIAYVLHRPPLAVRLAECCLQLQPDNVERLRQLAGFYQRAVRYDEAIATAQRCMELAQNLTDRIFAQHLMIQVVMIRGGYWQQGCQHFQQEQALLRQLLAAPPADLSRDEVRQLFTTGFFQPYFRDAPQENRALQNALGELCQTHLERLLPDPVATYRGRWRTGAAPSAQTSPQRLRVGYLSSCLRRHSVGWIVRWLFQHHDRERLMLHAYFVGAGSQGTDFLQDQFADWAEVAHRLPADALTVAQQIHDDEIDVLIDLDSATFDVACQVMALKPAPVQISWLGWDAPGIPAVDYFITDPYVLPDNAQADYRETLWRLPSTFVAIDGVEATVPSLRRDELGIPADAVIYLSAQRGQKLHPDTVQRQMQILQAVPNSYLLTKSSRQEVSLQAFFIQAAQAAGVAGDRLRFLPEVPSETTHRANLAIADVVLDTYPYNGATTTLETLWMGVPMVTQVGQQFSSRNSYSMMMNVGLTEGIAWTAEEYVEWGIRLGTDIKLRQKIGWQLQKVRHTARLWDTQRFTREMEEAYEQMWALHLESKR